MTTNLIGPRLGDFELIREIGRGGMGVVYEARQISLNRRVALKVLSGGLGVTALAVDRFRREAEAAARLHHANIVPIHATGEEAGTHFYAMELIAGSSLAACIRQWRQGTTEANEALPPELAATGPFAPGLVPAQALPESGSGFGSMHAYFDTIARLMADVADALEHAHQQGVIHRDVKPANLMLAANGRLCLTDFGLARLLEQPGLTVTGEFVGTPAYMSPEQVTAGHVVVDHRTDIYSLGATLYELLTLQPPFAADSRDRLLGMVVQKEPARPRRVNRKVPRELETICLKCLEKDPDRRYSTAGELAADLRKFVDRQPILARRPGPLSRLRKRAARNPALTGLATALVFALVIAGFFGVRSYRAEQDRIAQERQRDEERSAERRQAAIDRGMVAALAADFNAADAALVEAEGLGAGPEDTDLLRGVIETNRGNHDLAVACLERAVAARPDSIRAWALLCNARGDDDAIYLARESLAKLEGVPVVSPDDKLFKGSLVCLLRPAEGVAMMDAAMREHPSTLGLILLADARFWLGYNTGELGHALAAVQDTQALKAVFPNSTRIAFMSILAKLNAATAYNAAGDKLNAERLSKLAREETGPFRNDSLEAVVAKWYAILYSEGLKPRTEWTPAAVDPAIRTDDLIVFTFTLNERLFGRSEQANRIAADPHAGFSTINFRAILALDRPNGLAEAQRIWREFKPKLRDPAPAMVGSGFALLLGDPDEVVEVARRIRVEDQPLYGMTRLDLQRIRAYMLGEITDADFVKEKTESRVWQGWRHFLVGMSASATAIEAEPAKPSLLPTNSNHLPTCIGNIPFYILVLLEREPDWPLALRAKK